ncbi:MAG: phage major capsid protein [Bryobacteraceae bacterium]
MPEMIARANVQTLLPESVRNQIVERAPANSVVMSLAQRLADVPSDKQRVKVLDLLPQAYFVNGETGLKQTTGMAYKDAFLNIEEIAAIVPLPEATVRDLESNGYNLETLAVPKVAEAFGKLFDQAVLDNVNRPASWPEGLITQCALKSKVVDLSAVVGAGNDVYDAYLSEGGAFSMVEEAGYEVNGVVASTKMRARLRALRDENKQPIFKSIAREGVQGTTSYELDGVPLTFRRNVKGSEVGDLLSIHGDWSMLMWAMNQDITIKVCTEGVIQDHNGNIIYNLLQQDMVALRFVMRIGWVLPIPVSIEAATADNFPFSTLVA